MAAKYSLQEQKRLLLGAYTTGQNAKLIPREKHGRERVAYFEFLTGAADANTTTAAVGPINIADTLNLCTVPPGARILGLSLIVEALGTSATASIGIAGSASKYLSAADVSAIANIPGANTVALNYGDVPAEQAETPIVLTCAGANYANGKNIKGFVRYVVD